MNRTLALFLAAVAGLMAAYIAVRSEARRDLKRELAYNAAVVSEAKWRRAAESLAAVEKPQAETLTVRVTRWKAATTLVDTAWLHDTVAVPVEVVREVVKQADSTISACTTVLGTCEQRSVALDSVNASLKRQIAALPKPPSVFGRWGRYLLAGSVGYVAGTLRH